MDGRDLVWDHFKFNAEQRLRGFNFFVLLSIFANGGLFAALEKGVGPLLLVLLGAFVCVLSFVFWLIDCRSRQLLNITIPALKEIEAEFPETYRLFAIDEVAQGRLIRYTAAIRILLTCQLCFGLGVVAFGTSDLVEGEVVLFDADLFYDIAMALLPGGIAGYYAGLLMAKSSKFNGLKYEALRAVRRIDYIGDADKTIFTKTEGAEELHLIASELLTLKHRGAGKIVLEVSGELQSAIASSELGGYPVTDAIANLKEWQVRLRSMRPGFNYFLPWGQI